MTAEPGIPLAPFHTLPAAILQAWEVVCGMPFENLSKVIRFHDVGGDAAAALRSPDQVLSDHRTYGTGATCFALVYLFRHLLQQAGHEAALRTCDRTYGEDTHAAAVFALQSGCWMFDPGYRIFQPLPEPDGQASYRAPGNPNASRIEAAGAQRYDCLTGHDGHWRYRFTLKNNDISDAAFRRAWAASFRVDMMDYPVLNRFSGDRMIYLQKSRIVVRNQTESTVHTISPATLADAIAEHYGIDRDLAARALRLMR